MNLYTSGKQYASKDELSIGAENIENLTKSVDNRLVKVFSNNGNYITAICKQPLGLRLFSRLFTFESCKFHQKTLNI